MIVCNLTFTGNVIKWNYKLMNPIMQIKESIKQFLTIISAILFPFLSGLISDKLYYKKMIYQRQRVQ